MLKMIMSLFLGTLFISCNERVNTTALTNIEIIRDKWGVPHIKAPTNNEVAYGLAWVQCEDDFVTLQEQMLAVKGMLGELKGKDGLVADFGIKYMGLAQFAKENIGQLQEGTLDYLQSYVDGINNYAESHPDELLIASAFPLTQSDILTGYLLGIVEMSGAGKELQNILEGKYIKEMASDMPKGSNAIAISRNRTEEERTFLAINSHQPLEGWYSWYEAHLVSDEGLNILGGTFPGAATIFHGVNEDLGWAHTVNHADFTDVYRLEMHPTESETYKYDDNWLELEKQVHWSWMKVWGPLKIPIRQTNYQSVFGPAFEKEGEYFAWASVASRSVKSMEQWYKMNLAQNYSEFKSALDQLDIPCTNIVYADREDNILFASLGHIPRRDSLFDWKAPLDGNSSKVHWDYEEHYPFDLIPHIVNPVSGHVYNMNNTPYSASDSVDNFSLTLLNDQMGYQELWQENNRSARYIELEAADENLSYDEFKTIKYDSDYPKPLRSTTFRNLELLLTIQPSGENQKAIKLLNEWERHTTTEDTIAPLFIRSYYSLVEVLEKEGRMKIGATITKEDCIQAIGAAVDTLNTKFGTITPPLGIYQRHIRGDVDLPLGGGPDVLAAMYSRAHGEVYRGVAGESYIALVQFPSEGLPIIETVHAYGSSAEKDSPHYTDQMELFVRQELKPMTLDIDKVRAEADTIYHPLMVKK